MYLIERDSNNDILQSYAIYEERGIQLEKFMNLQKKKKKISSWNYYYYLSDILLKVRHIHQFSKSNFFSLQINLPHRQYK